jgi:hypothetical protein
MVTQLLWLFGLGVAVMIWTWHRRLLGEDLGTVSARWLHVYRSETH